MCVHAFLLQGCKECEAIAAAEDAAAQPDLLQAHLNALRLLVALMPGEPACVNTVQGLQACSLCKAPGWSCLRAQLVTTAPLAPKHCM